MAEVQVTVAGRTVAWPDLDDAVVAVVLSALVQSLGPAEER